MFGSDGYHNKAIDIKQIITTFYMEFTPEYAYNGEKHDFWEFVYVDKGELCVTADNRQFILKQGDIIFHMPNEFHTIKAVNSNAPNVIIVSFVTYSSAMSFFEKKIFQIPKEKNHYIAGILNEAKGSLKFLKNIPRRHESSPESPVFGAEQLMYAHLEMFLIDLYRTFNAQTPACELAEQAMDVTDESTSKLINDVIDYMKRNIHRNLQFKDFTNEFYVGGTYLKVLFKRCTGDSVLYYFRTLKMKEAKRLIRENRHNISEIAEMLGFDSIHYFSASFKKHYGMSPREYFNSIKLTEETLKAQSDM